MQWKKVSEITYVVACFLGKKRMYGRKQPDPYYCINEHLNFLSKLRKDNMITKAIFVINGGGVQELDTSNIKIPVQVINRENIDFSYGAWHQAILNDIESGSIPDYYFLIEDDYIPQKTTFYKNFIKNMKSDTAFVSQLILNTPSSASDNIKRNYDRELKVPEKHAAISNGLLKGSLCKTVFEKYNKVFKLTGSDSYEFGEYNQIIFLEYFTSLGYNLTDVSDYHSSEFKIGNERYVTYGNQKRSVVIRPIK